MYLAENKQESYIKPQNYEQTKKNKNKKKKHPYAKYNFEYNEETDTFTCPGGETLTLQGEKKSKSGTGYESKEGVYYTEKCHTLRIMKRRFRLETSHSERLTRRYMCEMKIAPLKMKMAPLKMKMRGVFAVVHRP